MANEKSSKTFVCSHEFVLDLALCAASNKSETSMSCHRRRRHCRANTEWKRVGVVSCPLSHSSPDISDNCIAI